MGLIIPGGGKFARARAPGCACQAPTQGRICPSAAAQDADCRVGERILT